MTENNNTNNKMIWIMNHPEYAWYPGKIIAKNKKEFIVEDDQQRQFNINIESALEVHPSCLTTTCDLLTLGDFNEGSLIHNIRERYKKDLIYTSVGQPIIISINPYKKLDIYSEMDMKIHKEYCHLSKLGMNNSTLEPHLFQIAENSYQELLNNNKNQSIIISGESGSGKTEAAKIILRYLTQISASNAEKLKKKTKSADFGIEEKVLDSNPILEAFGNAKTIRNDNSSRFGKFIEVYFDRKGKIQSANIINYLLEKSRLVTHQPGERNYHIFYQISRGFNQEEREKYQILAPENYKYLSKNDKYNYSSNMNDIANYQYTKNCFNALGFSEIEINELLQILSAILHIGNINFIPVIKKSIEGSEIAKDSIKNLQIAADFLGISSQNLEKIFCARQIQVGMDTTWKAYKVDEAEQNKDALVKEIYGRIFDWLINRINQSIEKISTNNEKDYLILGILDIYGFENFEVNSFEQLCINFTNEKLQQHFNDHIFKLEQEEYFNEGLQWKSISFTDNLMTIDLIEKSSNSIFALLEDECLIPKGNHANFNYKIYTRLTNYIPCPLLQRTNHKPQLFGIKHYAGDVYYDCRNFIEKNKDSVNPDVPKAFGESHNNIIKSIFTMEIQPPYMQTLAKSSILETRKCVDTAIKASTLTFKFRNQLNELMLALSETNSAYIRCIKPNTIKRPGIFDSLDVQRQLRCAGMLEAIKIRKNGYGIRRTHQEFLDKYRSILDLKSNSSSYEDCKRFLETMMNMPDLKIMMSKEKGLWALGKSKVFLKEELLIHLEKHAYNSMKQYIIKAQRAIRKFLLKTRVKKLLKLMKFILIIKKMIFKTVNYNIIQYQKSKSAKQIFKFWKLAKIRQKYIKISTQLRSKNKDGTTLSDLSPSLKNSTQSSSSSCHEESNSGCFKDKTPNNNNINNNKSIAENDDYLHIINKLKEDIEIKTKENNDLCKKLENFQQFKSDQNIENTIKEFTLNFDNTCIIKKDQDIEKIKELETKINDYKKKIIEKDNSINLLKNKLTFLERNLEVYKQENQFLFEELNTKKILYDEKLALEIDAKIMEEKLIKALGKLNLYEEEINNYKEKFKNLNEKLKNMEDNIKDHQIKYDEIKIKYDSIIKSEEFFKKEAIRVEGELNAKVDLIKKNEEYIQQLQTKIYELSLKNHLKDPITNQDKIDKDIKNITNLKDTISDKDDKDDISNKEKELEMKIKEKNIKLTNLINENSIIREINKTLIKIVKVKTILNEQLKLINQGDQEQNIQMNLEKFKNEEKQLLKILDGLMKKLQSIEKN